MSIRNRLHFDEVVIHGDSSTPLTSVSANSSNFLFSARRKRTDHSLSLPAETWTCFIEAIPHVFCVHTVVHVQLDHCSVSNISNVRIPFTQHDSVSGSDNLLH